MIIRMGILGSILAIFGSCSPPQEKDAVLFHIIYFKDIDGPPEMWEVHSDYFRYQDGAETIMNATFDAPLDAQEQKQLKEAFDAVDIGSLEEYYKGENTETAPGLVFRFYPGSDKEKTVQLRAFNHPELLHLLKIISDRSALPCGYLKDIENRSK